MNRSTKKRIVIGVVVLALAGGGWLWWHRQSTAPAADDTAPAATPASPTAALTVEIVHPAATRLPLTLAANGNIAAWQEASVGSEANGLRLAEVRVNVGDRVRRGQLLARFADAGVRADVAQAKAALDEAQAAAADASANATRATTLQASGALSAAQIGQYQTTAATAAARVASARAALDAQRLRLGHTRVLAPDAGVIAKRSATVGEVVGAGTELFRMIRQGRLEWRAEVTADELGRIKPGTRVHLRAANGAEIDGRVRTIAPTVDVQTRVALVYVDLPRTDAALAGMFASGRFELGHSEGLTLPQQAVVIREGYAYVFRVNADHHVTRLKVDTGRRIGERIEILGGVDAATALVRSGAGFLNDGDLVRVTAPAGNK